jgi:hypothetical protein
LEGTTTEEKQAKADEILETIADSTVVMDMIANNDNQAVKDIAQSITGEDAQILVDSISSNDCFVGIISHVEELKTRLSKQMTFQINPNTTVWICFLILPVPDCTWDIPKDTPLPISPAVTRE